MRTFVALLPVVAAAMSAAALPARRQAAFTSSTATSTATSSAAAASSTSTNSVSTVTVDGKTYVNHGLVAFGRIPHDSYDSYGESLGGLGSAIALESFRSGSKGSYTGTIRLQPDRGHNSGGLATSDYRARSHRFDLSFTPVDGSNGAKASGENLKLKYRDTLLYKNGFNYTTGLDPDGVRQGNPDLPIATFDNHVSFDAEGLVDIGDVLIVSDEYGPYIYGIEKTTGQVFSAIAPPNAILPKQNGKTNFTALADPTTGRSANQGFEGLTLDRKTGTLWALLQSATIQDGGPDKKTNRYTRLLGYRYDINSLHTLKPSLTAEYVVALPMGSKKTRASSELHIVGDGTFLVLARDGNGFGDTDSDSTYKNAALFNIKNATNIAGSKYDDPANPVAPGGKLVSDVTAAPVSDFVDLVDSTQLAKFGLHTGGAIDQQLVASKLESLALASLGDRQRPDDYFLFVVSDNDFITTKGKQAGQQNGTGEYKLSSYSDTYAEKYGSQDTQAFVYHVTLGDGVYQQPGFLGPN